MTRTTAPLARLVALACLLAVGLLLPALPASAAERAVLLSSSDEVFAARVGDSVLVRNDTLLSHTVEGAWLGGVVELDPGESTDAVVLSKAGDYAFTDAALLVDRELTVRVTAPTAPSPSPTPSPTPRADQPDPAPSTPSTAAATKRAAEREQARAAERRAAEQAAERRRQRAAAAKKQAAAAAAPSAATRSVGGSGVALAPSLGVGTSLPAPSLGAGPAPAVAPELGGVDPALLLSQGDPSAGVQGLVDAELQAAPGLGEPADGRRLGLPASVAVVALVGVASLILRVLLAEPVRR